MQLFIFVKIYSHYNGEKGCLKIGDIMAVESKFQRELKKEIESIFPGSIVIKTYPSYRQGIPDLIIFWGDKWPALECKADAKSKHRPNQDYYVNVMNEMSYSSFVYPENKQEVLSGLQQAFGLGRTSCVSKSE